jgi:hypothetical protein
MDGRHAPLESTEEHPVLIAQALGEYGALGALTSAIQNGSVRLEELAGEWGVEGIVVLVVVVVIWRAITAVR